MAAVRIENHFEFNLSDSAIVLLDKPHIAIATVALKP
jgi:hypothetical protein